MARIRQEDVEAVKERTDIVQLVGQYLTLRKSGHDSLTGLCPFHQEKTGSFSVASACSGVLLRSRRVHVASRVGASKFTRNGGGAVRLMNV